MFGVIYLNFFFSPALPYIFFKGSKHSDHTTPSHSSHPVWHTVSKRKAVMRQFLKDMSTKTCDHCHAAAVSYKKNRDSKIFQRVAAGKRKKGVGSGGVSGVESASEGSMRYVTPLEVMALLQRLWYNETEIVNLIWGGAHAPNDQIGPNKDGYQMFFLSVLPVPPNRYRPVNKVGDMLMEHPQNVYYSKVIDVCRQLVGSGDVRKGGDGLGRGGGKNGNAEENKAIEVAAKVCVERGGGKEGVVWMVMWVRVLCVVIVCGYCVIMCTHWMIMLLWYRV